MVGIASGPLLVPSTPVPVRPRSLASFTRAGSSVPGVSLLTGGLAGSLAPGVALLAGLARGVPLLLPVLLLLLPVLVTHFLRRHTGGRRLLGHRSHRRASREGR